jgi:hypothetical protein
MKKPVPEQQVWVVDGYGYEYTRNTQGLPVKFTSFKILLLPPAYNMDIQGQLPAVRGHLSISLPPLSSPTLPLFICISPTPLYHLQAPHPKPTTFVLKSPMTFQMSTTKSCQLPAPSSTHDSAALDKPWMHWDTST